MAIREARGRRTQQWLADRLGTEQTTISRWELGKVDLTLEQVRDLEEVLGVRPGTLLDMAGLISPEVRNSPPRIENVVWADPTVPEDMKEDVIALLRAVARLNAKKSARRER